MRPGDAGERLAGGDAAAGPRAASPRPRRAPPRRRRGRSRATRDRGGSRAARRRPRCSPGRSRLASAASSCEGWRLKVNTDSPSTSGRSRSSTARHPLGRVAREVADLRREAALVQDRVEEPEPDRDLAREVVVREADARRCRRAASGGARDGVIAASCLPTSARRGCAAARSPRRRSGDGR